MRFLFLALVLIVGILGAVVLMQKGQARIAAEAAAVAAAEASARQDAAQAPVATAPAPATPAAPAQAMSIAQATPASAAPASEAGDATPPVKKPAEPAAPAFQVVAKPAIAAAGVLETTRGRVTLKDIAPLDPAEVCGQGASAWPCGQLAATQFRRFLRGRSVQCDIEDPAWQGDVTARCTLGKQDIGKWLVEQGWGRAQPGSPYEETGREAEAARRGIFAAGPRRP